MTTVIIESSSISKGKKLLESKSITAVKGDTQKKSFREAAVECEAVSVTEFFDEVRRQVKEHYDSHA